LEIDVAVAGVPGVPAMIDNWFGVTARFSRRTTSLPDSAKYTFPFPTVSSLTAEGLINVAGIELLGTTVETTPGLITAWGPCPVQVSGLVLKTP
jgi:hypothetical protein